MAHLVLLGDSIFDNASYVQEGLHVLAQLQHRLSPGWKATLLAVDGSTSEDLHGQVERIPGDASHLILSAGGNDALRQLPVLQEECRTMSEAVERLAAVAEEFRFSYDRAVGWLLERGLPVTLCTIYHPHFPDARFQRISEFMLAVFNDVIIGRAVKSGLPVLDLRRLCDKPEDFSNTIEPSEMGGKKIVAAINRLLREYSFVSGRTEIFA